jgi:hypothetical protein
MRRSIFSLIVALSCQTTTATKPNAMSCPPGTRSKPDRAKQILEKLRNPEISEASLCFGELWPSRVITNGPYLLDESASDAALAARLGHLAEHQRLANLFDTPNKKDCEHWVGEVLAAEAGAYAIELRLRRGLGVTEDAYAFEEEFWRAGEEGEAVILRYLQEHPSGGGGVDALGAGYLERCQKSK